MTPAYDVHAPKRAVNLSLNEDLVRRASTLTADLSEQVERLLADYVAGEQRRREDFEKRLDDAIAALNEFDAKHGSFADDYIDL